MAREIRYPDHASLRVATEGHIAGLRSSLGDAGAGRERVLADIRLAESFLAVACVPSHALTGCETRCGWDAVPGCCDCDF